MKTRIQQTLSLIFLLFLGISSVNAQAAGDFRSHQTGNWSDVNSWERYDGTNWITPAPNAPTGAEATITVQSGHTITVNVAVTINGYLKDSGVMTVSGGSLTFNNGSTYELAHPTASGQGIPTVTWNAGSTCLLTGITTATTGVNANQAFYNLTVNCPGWTGNLNLGWNSGTTTINGNVSVLSTGTGRWQFCAPAAAASATVTINGNLSIDGSASTTTNLVSVTSNGTSNGTTTITVNVGGNITVIGNAANRALTNFSLSRGSQGGTGTATWNLSGEFLMSNATTQNSNNAGAKFVFVKPGIQNLRFSNDSLGGGAINYTVNSGSTLDLDTSVIAGSGSFILNSGSTLATRHASGINGNITCTGANGGGNSFSTGANYTFNGSAAQVTGSSLPATVNNLTIDNISGVTLTSTAAVNGILGLTNGNLNTVANTLAISSTGSVTRTNGQVVGLLQKNAATGSNVTRTFEVGSGSSYTPVSVNFASVTVSGDLVASTTGSEHPNIGTSGIDATKDVNRYWSLTNNGIGFTTYDAVFNFVPGDIDAGANPNNFVAAKYSGGSWSGLTEGIRTATSLQVLGVGSFSDFAIGQPPATTVISNGTGGGNWANTSTWQGGAIPSGVDSVVILGSDSVFILATSSCAGLLVQSGGKLGLAAKLSPTNVTLNGKITVHADTLSPSGSMTVSNTGIYQHARDGGRFPTPTWATGSTCLITGATTIAPASGNQNFYHVTWDCPAQTANLNMGWNNITIAGNITVVNTSAGRWQMMAPVVGASATVTIMGDVVQSAGNFTTNGTGNGTTTIVVNHYGNIIVTGGNFAISRGSQGGTGTSTWNLYNGNMSITNGTVQNSTTLAGGAKYIFKKAGTQTLALNSVTFAGGGIPMQVDSGTTLSTGTSVVRGSGIFTVNAGATLACGNPGGLDSLLQNSGTRTLSTSANYTFNAAALQVTGTLLPGTVNGLTINNVSSTTLSVPLVVNGFLATLNGDLLLNGNNVTLGPLAILNETSGNTVSGINGVITTTRTLTAPNVANNIAGMGIQIGSIADLGSTVIRRGHAPQTNAGQNAINRYFDITPTNNSGLNATLVFKYDDSELNGGSEQSLGLYRSTDGGTTWIQAGGTVDATANTISLSGVNTLSRWTAATRTFPSAPLLVSPANGATVSADSVRCIWQQSTPAVTNYWFERATDSLFTANRVVDSTLTDTSKITRQLVSNQTYWWRVRAKNAAGLGPFSTGRRFIAIFTGVDEATAAPLEFSLKQNYPNPFNPSTNIKFSVEKSARATLEIYNILGQRILTVFDEVVEAGRYYTVQFNGQGLPSGIYFYRLQSANKSDMKKLILIK
jgi:hypothetical protein